MSIAINIPRASALEYPDLDQRPISSSPLADDFDPVTAAARTAGRLAGERLARTPLNPRQRATVASLMGGDAK